MMSEKIEHKLVQSYVRECWFVSTIYRRSSASIIPDLWYYETMVWAWNKKERKRENSFIWQEDSGSFPETAMERHFIICKELFDKNHLNDMRED